MQKNLLENLEALLDVNGDSFDVALGLIRSEVLDIVDIEHLSAVTVARDLLKIGCSKESDAKIIMMSLAYPAENQAVIASLCGVSTRTVKRTFARWRRIPWIGNLADLRSSIAPRQGGRS